ncbi:MAG: LPS export ABC transporter periplasmic protein LptC, partial [Pseudomonadota bacterium]
MKDPLVKAKVLRVERHSSRVRHLRLAVPALAVGLALTYALSATPPKIDRDFAEQFSGLQQSDDGARLASPRYSGEDLSGQPFEVVAATATRETEDPSLVDLVNPAATRVSEAGDRVTVTALDGLFDQDNQVMDLANDVEMQQRSSSGDLFTLLTDAAQVDLEGQVVTSDTEVRGIGDGITLRADRGTVFQTEDR